MPRSRSRSFESITRSVISWLARKAPLCRSMASTRVVLPWSTWAMMATLRSDKTLDDTAPGLPPGQAPDATLVIFEGIDPRHATFVTRHVDQPFRVVGEHGPRPPGGGSLPQGGP